ncbi:hypothetical protein AMTRI_Chr11g100830 [Amborella trichopoda]
MGVASSTLRLIPGIITGSPANFPPYGGEDVQGHRHTGRITNGRLLTHLIANNFLPLFTNFFFFLHVFILLICGVGFDIDICISIFFDIGLEIYIKL